MNALWIQHESHDKEEYMFLGREQISLKNIDDNEKLITLRQLLFNNEKNRKIIWQPNDYSQTEVSILDNGYFISGELNDTDESGRKMPFMYFLAGEEIEKHKEYMRFTLSEINKSISEDLLNEMFKRVESSKKKLNVNKKLILVLLIITVIISIIFYFKYL